MIAIRHVVDSLTGLRVLEARHATAVVDLGSGGGFPGIPLVATLASGRGVLVESVGKKARFLDTVVAATSLPVQVLAMRAEAIPPGTVPPGAAVIARAVAPLADLIELAFPLLEPGGSLVAWKSQRALAGEDGAELGAARRAIAAMDPDARIAVEPAVPDDAGPVVDDLRDHRLVIVTRSGGPIGAGWPRDPAARKRRPW